MPRSRTPLNTTARGRSAERRVAWHYRLRGYRILARKDLNLYLLRIVWLKNQSKGSATERMLVAEISLCLDRVDRIGSTLGREWARTVVGHPAPQPELVSARMRAVRHDAWSRCLRWVGDIAR